MMNEQITDNYININTAAKFLGVSVRSNPAWLDQKI